MATIYELDCEIILTGKMINLKEDPYENGNVQAPRYALCFETQKDAIGYNEVNKEDVLLKSGEIYHQKSTFSFRIR